jgi:uncharacterized protein
MLAVITGASSGIGATFARRLGQRGYDLLLIARREDRLQSLAGEIRDLSRVKVEVLAADLTREEDRERVAERIQSASDLGLLVNNAGFGSTGYFFEADLRLQLDMHELHVLATMRLCHAAVMNLLNGSGKRGIINVSSVAGFTAAPQSVSYGATKRWMNGFSEALAIEVEGKGITIQALCPGYTLSEFHDRIKVDRAGIPASLWMTADFVVQESLAGFDRGDLYVIPGWRYKALTVLIKMLPGRLLRWGAARAVGKYRRQKV